MVSTACLNTGGVLVVGRIHMDEGGVDPVFLDEMLDCSFRRRWNKRAFLLL
jgi:hypothetical protein